MTAMSTPVVQVSMLHREFGDKIALRNVSLTIPEGCVYGLVGGNGAGKTTLIRHVLGLYRPQFGDVRLFGLDPCAVPEQVLARLGYLSEDRDLPLWMRVDELIGYTRAFYPRWDGPFAEELLVAFDLPRTQRVKSLSRGQLARLGLLLALAYRPDLLVLDEPSSGLDPIVRRDILGAVIRTVADEGRTVLFSSHLLDEVDRVADRVCMLHAGKVVLDDSVDAIKERYQRCTVRFPQASATPPVLTGATPLDTSPALAGGREWRYLLTGPISSLSADLAAAHAELLDETNASLDEVFVAASGGRT
jgi:ABC-2 type transport system ATP-binding protein